MKNPYLNGTAVAVYIFGIGLLFQFGGVLFSSPPDAIIYPIAGLSLLVFSVAVMGFIFFYWPVSLLLESKKEEAAAFFLKTLLTFGLMTLVSLFLLRLV